MRIGFIGTGHIAAPMARHLARKGHDITVTRRSTADFGAHGALRDALTAIGTRLKDQTDD